MLNKQSSEKAQNIDSVKKLAHERYIINDKVIISDFIFEDDNISYKIDYDEELIQEESATELANKFILDALESAMEKD